MLRLLLNFPVGVWPVFCLLTVWGTSTLRSSELQLRFSREIKPFLETHCERCHDADKMKSGVRVDHLDGRLPETQLRLWRVIKGLVEDHEMPPEDELQPSDEARQAFLSWVEAGLHEARTREVPKNGLIRRLTVSQYRNTLRELLGIDDDLTGFLPPEAVSRDGFLNNKDTMILSPLLLETYFEIAEKALDRCLVDATEVPTIQTFRMDLGQEINPAPLPEELILGANSRLLPNAAFVVSELAPAKPFVYQPFEMQRRFRFVEGYQGNSTVRGWREYDSLYHAVFACMRGSYGYPLGNPFDLVPEGLLLRPAIPSAELFQVESTYGPKANFKVSLRELPDQGEFRVTVKAAKYDDGLLAEMGVKSLGEGLVVVSPAEKSSLIDVPAPGVYQVELHRLPPPGGDVKPDASHLAEARLGHWTFEDGESDSPFGKGLGVGAAEDAVSVLPSEDIDVGTEAFTFAAWIRPREIRNAGIVGRGESRRRGWSLDLVGREGRLRFRSFKDYDESAGVFQSQPGVLRANRWQHVAAVIDRGPGKARLYVNGYQVAEGTVAAVNLDEAMQDLQLGRTAESWFPGDIDECWLFGRALGEMELQALIEPGRALADPPPDGRQAVTVTLGERHFTGTLNQPAFVTVRLPAGSLPVAVDYRGFWQLERMVLAPVTDPKLFEQFEQRPPILGVHVGLRRDCGSTLDRVGQPVLVSDTQLHEFVFEGAIENFPSPDVEKNNVNYISGLREIGVRSEYTDGKQRPRLLVSSVEFEGPYYETWPPLSHQKIFHHPDPEIVIESFAERAFRRPLRSAEKDSLMRAYQQSFALHGDVQTSVREVLVIILTSPQFLFQMEESVGPEAERLDEYELASKLTYFLWDGPPDSRLLRLAGEGRLHASLNAEIDRLLDDGRVSRFAEAFVSQWLSLDKVQTVETDRERYPALTREVKQELRREPIEFFKFALRENRPVAQLVDSDWIVTNEVLADYYGVPLQRTRGFVYEMVKHGRKELGGLLTQAGILAGLSDGREANPIKRGAWLARKIIAEPPADPPPNVPDLSEDFKHLSLREQLAHHRNQEGCAKCHEGIDPWGFPLEEFDAGGRYQALAEADSVLPDGTLVRDSQELKAYLSGERLGQVIFSVVKHLATYAVGRDLTYNEVEFLRKEALDTEHHQRGLRDWVRFLIHSDIFLKK